MSASVLFPITREVGEHKELVDEESMANTRRSPVISVTEVNLARVPRALEGEAKGGSSLEGAGKGRLWRKGSRKGVD
jgi:hypothetical protein